MNVVVTTMVAAAKGSKRNDGFLIQKIKWCLKIRMSSIFNYFKGKIKVINEFYKREPREMMSFFSEREGASVYFAGVWSI
jgi:hypothetical protein